MLNPLFFLHIVFFIGKNPKAIWQQVDEALQAMLLSRELALASATSDFASSRNFFEMIRVDFVIDEDLNVFIMEVEVKHFSSTLEISFSKHFY